jgi:predicted MFS family arabinose efflux permease
VSASDHQEQYQRDALTWTSFAALFAFGLLNAALGPALPYLRAIEHTGYLAGALHQVAISVGGGLAGVITARAHQPHSRELLIRGGLASGGVAGLGLAFGNDAVLTIAAAFALGLTATLALIPLWAQLADHHGPRRPVAMSEGEVAVSLAGILMPALTGALAATVLGWRGALIISAVVACIAATMASTERPRSRSAPVERARRRRLPATLVVIVAIVGLEFTLSFWLATYLVDNVGVARSQAVEVVSGLYAANLLGRLLASRLARRRDPRVLLAAALITALAGLPLLLAAQTLAVAAPGIVITGAGIGATFPLAASLHIKASDQNADAALGQILSTAAIGQLGGPLLAGAIAQLDGLRAGLLMLPALAALAGAALLAVSRR